MFTHPTPLLAMQLQPLDWAIIAIFFVVVVGIGIVASRFAGKSSGNYFLGGRTMPWWLLGISMVACTFSCDTPNLVTDIVRNNGVSGNWVWWAFLLTGMLTVFIYAKLWRRSEVVTDLEFYELRYSGKAAAFLRGFRALYLGVFFNCAIMGAMETTSAAVRASSPDRDLRHAGTLAAKAGRFCHCGTCERTRTPSGPRWLPQRFASSAWSTPLGTQPWATSG